MNDSERLAIVRPRIAMWAAVGMTPAPGNLEDADPSTGRIRWRYYVPFLIQEGSVPAAIVPGESFQRTLSRVRRFPAAPPAKRQ